MTQTLEVPAFLKRNKDNTLKQKSKVKTPVLIHKGNGAQVTVDVYAGLSDTAKGWVQREVKTNRFREAWLDDKSTVAFVEKQATQAADTRKMSDETKVKLKASRPVRPSREGLVGIATIASELKIIPREARGALRAMKKVKPATGWSWSPDEAAKIKGEIERWLSSQRVKGQLPKNGKSSSKTPSEKSPKPSAPKNEAKRSSKSPGKRTAPSKKSPQRSKSLGADRHSSNVV